RLPGNRATWRHHASPFRVLPSQPAQPAQPGQPGRPGQSRRCCDAGRRAGCRASGAALPTSLPADRGGVVGEPVYLLPLPKGAAFEDLALSINDEMVTGETMGADRARAVYEEIVRRLRDPALVEWMGHGLLRTRIFPVQPGEEKRVVVRFRAVAEREGDALRLAL